MLKKPWARSHRWKKRLRRGTPAGSRGGHRTTWRMARPAWTATRRNRPVRNRSAASASGSAATRTYRTRTSRRPFASRRLIQGFPERSAESSVAAAKASTGPASGKLSGTRAALSRRRRRGRAPPAGRPARHKMGVLPREGAHRGEPEDLQIEAERPALDVVEVVLDPPLERGVAAPAVDLGPPGDPGLHLVAQHVAGDLPAELLHEDRPLGARAHEAHLPAEHVEELGQLVQAEPAQEGSQPRPP